MVWIAQPEAEFVSRTLRAESSQLVFAFRCIQLVLSGVAVLTNAGFFILLSRHRSLQKRNFQLLGAIAAVDLLFGVSVLLTVAILPLLTSDVVPFDRTGRGTCQVWGVLINFSKALSLFTYALIAFERYRAFVTPLLTLSDQRLRCYYLCLVSMAAAATMLSYGALGGVAVQPSGAWCGANLFEHAQSGPIAIFTIVTLGSVVALNYKTYRHITRRLQFARTSNPADMASAIHARSVIRGLLTLVAYYIVCYAPLIVNIALCSFQVTTTAQEPLVDMLTGIGANCASAGAQFLNLWLFSPLRVALRHELGCRAASVRPAHIVEPNHDHARALAWSTRSSLGEESKPYAWTEEPSDGKGDSIRTSEDASARTSAVYVIKN